MAPQGQRNIKIVIWLSPNICTHAVVPRHVDLQALEGIVCVSGGGGRGFDCIEYVQDMYLCDSTWQNLLSPNDMRTQNVN